VVKVPDVRVADQGRICCAAVLVAFMPTDDEIVAAQSFKTEAMKSLWARYFSDASRWFDPSRERSG